MDTLVRSNCGENRARTGDAGFASGGVAGVRWHDVGGRKSVVGSDACGFVVPASGGEVRGRLGQVAEHQGDENERRQCARDEHRTPPGTLQQDEGEQGRRHGADVVAGHDGGRRGSLFPGREFGDDGQRGGQCAAEAEAREEAQDAEHLR